MVITMIGGGETDAESQNQNQGEQGDRPGCMEALQGKLSGFGGGGTKAIGIAEGGRGGLVIGKGKEHFIYESEGIAGNSRGSLGHAEEARGGHREEIKVSNWGGVTIKKGKGSEGLVGWRCGRKNLQCFQRFSQHESAEHLVPRITCETL